MKYIKNKVCLIEVCYAKQLNYCDERIIEMITRLVQLFMLLYILVTPSFSKNKKVLILNSYHEGYHWTDRIMSGIKSVLNDESEIELYIDYMDTKRKSDQYYYKQLKDLYAHKYSLVDFDLVLSSDDNALNFLLNYRDELFPGIPIVFCGINKFEPSRIEGHYSITGVYESYDVVGTIQLMLKLHPNTRKIYAICDNTYSGDDFRGLVMEAEGLFSSFIDFIYLTNIEMDLLKNRLQNLEEDSLVLWTVYLRTP